MRELIGISILPGLFFMLYIVTKNMVSNFRKYEPTKDRPYSSRTSK